MARRNCRRARRPGELLRDHLQRRRPGPYHLWMRGKADKNAGRTTRSSSSSRTRPTRRRPGNRIGTTAPRVSIEDGTNAGLSGWGWADDSYGAAGADVFRGHRPAHLRVQVREDGLSLDQIVLSSGAYLTRRRRVEERRDDPSALTARRTGSHAAAAASGRSARADRVDVDARILAVLAGPEYGWSAPAWTSPSETRRVPPDATRCPSDSATSARCRRSPDWSARGIDQHVLAVT